MSTSDGRDAEPIPKKEREQSLSSDSSEDSSSSSEGETASQPPNKRPRNAHFDVDSIINQVSYLTNILLHSQAVSGEGPSTNASKTRIF